MHPFLALVLGALVVGIVAGQNVNDVITSFSTGFGDTSASVGALIALGAMFAKLLADSGGRRPDRRHHRPQGVAGGAALGDGGRRRRSSACRCSSRSAWSC